jgi:hypothetical protein
MIAKLHVIPQKDVTQQGYGLHSPGRSQWIESIFKLMQPCDDSSIANKGDKPRKSSIEELALHYTPKQHENKHNCTRRHSTGLSCDCPTLAIYVAGATVR